MIAEDDEGDRILMEKSFESLKVLNKRIYTENGEDLLNYLENKGKYQNASEYPLPGIILLDMNMPKVDGREVIARTKSDPKFKTIPIIVMTSSKAEEEIVKTYNLGVNSYIQKPIDVKGLEVIFKALEKC
ncbi:two-component system response regulator [Candidatus Aerophobetes bacterium]|uniref:Two-component system response regulator n=1 Tax=Aerophobetes bacterium TaxID=2030807 RepID=A0A2A4YEJ9_UNCAE|nr:MAG: two-component system response regulator [Candidatus Aerophobetes bacterium]